MSHDHGEDELIERELEAERRAARGPINWPVVALLAVMFIFCALRIAGVLHAQSVDDYAPMEPLEPGHAIKALLGEARGEGYDGMYAVACAIRNRGTLEGVAGMNAQMEPIGDELYQLASKAWYTSEYGPDPTHGATHWENVEAFGEPAWAGDMEKKPP